MNVVCLVKLQKVRTKNNPAVFDIDTEDVDVEQNG